MTIILIILFIISFFLESLVPNLLNDFFPFFIISTILIGSMFNVNDNKYYVIIFITGMLYDLTFINVLFLDAFVFSFIGYLSKLIVSKNVSFIKNLFFYYVLSVAYVLFLYLFTFFYIPLNTLSILDKILGGLFINTFYFSLLYFIFIGIERIISNRRKKCSYF